MGNQCLNHGLSTHPLIKTLRQMLFLLIVWYINGFILKDVSNVSQQDSSIPVISHMTSVVDPCNLEHNETMKSL